MVAVNGASGIHLWPIILFLKEDLSDGVEREWTLFRVW